MPRKAMVPCSNCTDPCVEGIHADRDHGTPLCPKCHNAIYGRGSKRVAKHEAIEKKFTAPKKTNAPKLTCIQQNTYKPTGKPNHGEARAQPIPNTSEFEGLHQIKEKHVRGSR